MNTKLDNQIKVINKTLRKFGSLGKQGDRLFIEDGNLMLDGRRACKMVDDSILLGVSGGKMLGEIIYLLNMIDNVQIIRRGPNLFLNGKSWSGELTYISDRDGSWTYKVE